MENLEEVLQALDEFQKMRPSEIPRELEDYLCWVAKTGDPVYQWSLIKTLFREKLTRVMADFYESCPTLELAPCPNVEHFNYDTMKSNLLERLESFANAPFTVQRICELLTAPRKEYNRVDKFMRAIEKNILVVSTREPGPIARRNENGDGMVNGSVDEDTSIAQPPQDVEMEYWEKDSSSTVTISVHTVESETSLLHTVVPNTSVVKNVFSSEELSHEKVESTSSKSDIAAPNFAPASEFSGISNINSQAHTQDSQIGLTMQNLSTVVPEASGIVSDVSDAIMNEDTSSQPSLELENEPGDSIDSSRKLQTTFQTKDFNTNDNKSSKFYVDNSKVNEKTDVALIPVHVHEGLSKSSDVLVKPVVETKTVLDKKESVNTLSENFLATPNENFEDVIKSDASLENCQTITNAPLSSTEHKESLTIENTNVVSGTAINNSEQSLSNVILSTDDINTEQTSNTSEDISIDVENLKHGGKETELVENSKPIVEEPCPKDDVAQNFSSDKKNSNLTITEATEDETTAMKSIVPDPIPIVEEPKDTESATVKEETSRIVEISEETESKTPIITSKSESEDKMSVDDIALSKLTDKDITPTANNTNDSDAMIENVISRKGEEAVELMEVDEEETMQAFQQSDEPMEQETAQSPRS